MRHCETIQQDLVRGRVHHNAAVFFSISPAGRFIALPQSGDVTNLTVTQAKAAQASTILAGHKYVYLWQAREHLAVLNTANGETGKERVDKP